MFDEILAYLFDEDTTGCPIRENFDYPSYTLEGKVDAMLDDLWAEWRSNHSRAFDILAIRNMLQSGRYSWHAIMEEMERLSSEYENEEE